MAAIQSAYTGQAAAVIGPSGDTTGAADTANINTLTQAGKVAQLQAGTYYVKNLTVDTNGAIIGVGTGTILQAVAGTTGYMITQKTAASTRKILLRDFALVPNTGTLGGVQLDATGFGTGDVQHQVRGVFVTGSGGDAFNFGANLRGVIVSGCSQYNSEGYGYNIASGTTDCFFTDCVSGPSKQHGFYVTGGNNLIKGCKSFYAGYDNNAAAWGTTQAGFYLNGCSYVTMVGCSAQQSALHGIDMQSAQYCTVTGCEADTNSAGTGVTTGVGINTNGCIRCAVIANSGANNVALSPGAQAYGIQVAGTQTGTVFIGNAVTGTSGAFNYVSGSGYLNLSATTADLSGAFLKIASPQLSNDSAQALSNGSTIGLSSRGQYGAVPVTATGTVTGLILDTPGNGSWSVVTIINESAFTLTFAASGTSRVADGSLDVISANTARTYVYDGNTALWYRFG